MKKFSQIVIVVVGVAVLGGAAYGINKFFKYQKEDVPVAVDIFQLNEENKNSANGAELPTENDPTTTGSEQQSSNSDTSTDSTDTSPSTEDDSTSTSTTPPDTPTPLPKELNLELDFYSQAPFGNWDYPWQEACEEASVLLIANAYFKHNWSAQEFNQEILKLVDWQKKTFGAYEHTNMDETAQILEEYLKLDTITHENPTFEDIQKIIAKGHLIVVPVAGKQIGNPFYTNGGPVYHVMVIKGYKEGEKVITHDVGTKRGENYVYSWKTMQNALHDYAEPISAGPKRIIEVIPPQT